jgi:peptide/nickel transport system ATP-binding protein
VSTLEQTPTAAAETTAALELRDLDVVYRVRGHDRQVLRGISLRVERGESVGLVGESGCGKSTAAMAIVRYLPRNGRVRSGSVLVDGRDVWGLSGRELRALRSGSVSMVYQNPGAALNPSIRIGSQVAEVFTVRGLSRADARERAIGMLRKVQIADPDSVMGRYPHQLSGGMQQRVVIAMALATDPSLLILDEPTTGLDATVEAEVLDLVRGLRSELGTSILFISHNLGVIASMCDRVGVLYAGELVEEGPAQQVLHDPRHPYSVGLLRCIPRAGARKDEGRLDTIPGFLPQLGAEIPGCVFSDRCALVKDICITDKPPLYDLGGRRSRCHFHEQAQDLPRETSTTLDIVRKLDRTQTPVLRVDSLAKTFRQGGHDVHALADVSASLWAGETLGLVGESGSGKTTFARTLLGIVEPTAGHVDLDGRQLPGPLSKRSRDDVRAMQIVFQNPDSALNRRHSIRKLLGRTLKKLSGITGKEAEARMLELTQAVRLADRYLSVRPTQLSGGQKQRVAIARAFAGSPRVVVCDEPTSALDVSVQAAILNLLGELQARENVSYVFISHDLGVVRYLSDRIAVLYLGRLMELGPAEVVFGEPHHPYTEALLSAVATIDGEGQRIRLEGEIPSAANPPSGCVFHTRCPRYLGAICDDAEPPLVEVERDHSLRCHIPLEQLRQLQAAGPPPPRRRSATE